MVRAHRLFFDSPIATFAAPSCSPRALFLSPRFLQAYITSPRPPQDRNRDPIRPPSLSQGSLNSLTELLQVLARPEEVDPDAVGEPEPRPEGRDGADDGQHGEHAGPVRGRGHGLGVEHAGTGCGGGGGAEHEGKKSG